MKISISIIVIWTFSTCFIYSQTQSACSKFDNIIVESTKTCEGSSNGSIRVIIPKDTKDKDRPFVITLNPKDVNRLAPGDTTTFENLASGPYQIMISDGAFCVKIIKDTIKTEAVFPFTLLHGNAGCNDQGEPINNGSINVAPIIRGRPITVAGFAQIKFEWSNGATTHTIGGLDVGKYYVTVTNDFGLKCIKIDSIEITRNGKTERGGSNFNDPGEELKIDRESNIRIGMGTNGTNAILTENTSFSSFQFDLLPDIDEFQSMNATFHNHTTDDMIVIIFHRDGDRQIIQRFPDQIFPPQSNGTLSFNFDQLGRSTDRIQFLVDSETGSGPINGEVDDIELLNPVLPPSDDLLILNGPMRIDELQELDLLPDEFLRSAAEGTALYTICNPDTIPLSSGFIVQGGTTPYSLAWDLDGDETYDDAFGDSTFVTNLVPGLYNIGLKVSDADGQTDTSRIRIEILENVQYQIAFPDMQITVLPDEVINHCIEDGLIRLATVPPGGMISGTGIVNDSFFDPQLAGPGGHVLSVEGSNLCDQLGLVTINVQAQRDPSWEDFSVFICDKTVNLNDQIRGDTIGSWYINGTYRADGLFDPSAYEEDSVRIAYAMGLPPCNVFETKTIVIAPAPDPELNLSELEIDACEGMVSLQALVVGDAAGIWSGGDYIVNDSLDPTNLESGSYSAVYSVGSGDCLRSDTLQLNVSACATRINLLSKKIEISISPNPGFQDEIQIRLKGNESLSLAVDLYTQHGQLLNRFGPIYSSPSAIKNWKLDPGVLTTGVYLLRFQDETGAQLVKRWVKM